jgi:ribulose-phosphate 3-epimerase
MSATTTEDAPARTATGTSPVSIVPSVLPADFARLGEEVAALEEAGVDRIQWDVMDGRFVPNLTFGPDVIAACRKHASVPFEAHLMVLEPDELMQKYVDAGCEVVIVHAEACTHLHRTMAAIRDAGAKAGVALNPHTPLDAVRHVIDLTDLLLVMTVNPGFGGQAYIATMEPKIAEAASLIEASGHDVELEVDGGISPDTVGGAAAAGARILVAGSALYKHEGGLADAVATLRARALEAIK